MHTGDYQYQLNQTRRADFIREARRQQILRTISERQASNRPHRAAALLVLLQSLFR